MIQKLLLKKLIDKATNKKMIKSKNIQEAKEKAKNFVSSNLKVKNFDDFKSKALTAVFVVGGSYASWRFIVKPYFDKRRENKENNRVLTDPNTKLASLLQQAIIGVGTDNKTVFIVAQKIKDWKAVQTSYKKLTGNNLNEDLKGDLSSNNYRRFINIVSKNSKAQKSISKRGYIVVSSKKVRLRSTPDSTISAYSFNSNILDTIDSRKFIGFATGVYKTDSNGVLYYQVRIKYTAGIPAYHKDTYKELKSRILTFWIGAGAIEMFREFKKMRASYPTAKVYKGTKDTGLRQALK